MHRKSVFIIRAYAALALFFFCAYILTFSQNTTLKSYLVANLASESDYFPKLKQFAALFFPQETAPATGFHRFLMPVEGDIVGEETKVPDGVIVRCKPGTKVIAGDDGKISAIRYSSNVGWYVDIDHGSGIFSRYTNVDCITKKIGEKVYRGEVIAKVANKHNGNFYLQLFVNGQAVNPVTATLIQKGI